MSLKRNTAATALGLVAAALFTTTLMAADSVEQQSSLKAEASKPGLSKPPLIEENVAPGKSLDAAGQTRWLIIAEKKRELTRDVTWLSHEPLVFLMRRGDHFDDEADRYQRMCDPENLKRMAAAGVRWGRLFFYKGFGLEYERANIEQAKRAAEVMHQSGMKVALYMAGTMFTETLYREVPEAKNWEQRDQNDLWVPYGIQTFRHYACPNEPAYREYLKRILRDRGGRVARRRDLVR